MYDTVILVCTILAAITGIVCALPVFGFDVRIKGRAVVGDVTSENPAAKAGNKTRSWIAVILSIASLLMASFNFYRLTHKEVERARVPNVLVAWTGADKGCISKVDTSWIISVKDKYRIFVVCHIPNPSVDELENTAIAISSPFNITGGLIIIRIDYKSSSEIKKRAKPGTQTSFSIVLLPKDQDGSKIQKLGDVQSSGGLILTPGVTLP